MINVSFVDFYSTFDVEQNIFIYTLRKVLGDVAVIESNRYKESDIIIFSVFGNEHQNFSEEIKKRAIMWIGENQRPNFNACSYSISCDFDSHYGFNFRLPLWMLEIDWFDKGLGVIKVDNIEEALCNPRVITREEFETKKYCITIFNNPEPTRVYLYQRLNSNGTVDGYGRPFNNWFATDLTYRDKMMKLSGYKFNLCPENSYWPGYYTEKCVHSKIADV